LGKRVEVVTQKDARGEMEIFTWDLFFVVDARLTIAGAAVNLAQAVGVTREEVAAVLAL
jgi:hypothetical protein